MEWDILEGKPNDCGDPVTTWVKGKSIDPTRDLSKLDMRPAAKVIHSGEPRRKPR